MIVSQGAVRDPGLCDQTPSAYCAAACRISDPNDDLPSTRGASATLFTRPKRRLIDYVPNVDTPKALLLKAQGRAAHPGETSHLHNLPRRGRIREHDHAAVTRADLSASGIFHQGPSTLFAGS